MVKKIYVLYIELKFFDHTPLTYYLLIVCTLLFKHKNTIRCHILIVITHNTRFKKKLQYRKNK